MTRIFWNSWKTAAKSTIHELSDRDGACGGVGKPRGFTALRQPCVNCDMQGGGGGGGRVKEGAKLYILCVYVREDIVKTRGMAGRVSDGGGD